MDKNNKKLKQEKINSDNENIKTDSSGSKHQPERAKLDEEARRNPQQNQKY